MFAALARVGGSPRRALGRTALYLLRDARRLLRQRARDWSPQTGKLAKSLTFLLDSMSVVVGSNLAYAAIQQLGGTVRPKEGRRYLAIPVLPSLRRGGVWPRDLPEGRMKFVRAAPIRIGSHAWTGPALVRATEEERVSTRTGKTRRVGTVGEVMYALIRRATIRGRPYLIFSSEARRFLVRELAMDYRRAMRGR